MWQHWPGVIPKILSIIVVLFYIDECAMAITLSPLRVDQWEMSDVTLNCSDGNNSMSVVKWSTHTIRSVVELTLRNECLSYVDGFLEKEPERYSYSCTDGKTFVLTLKNVTSNQHKEVWWCEAFTKRSNDVPIHVKVPVRDSFISSYNKSLAIPENVSIVYQCKSSECRPQPLFQWYIKSPNGTTTTILETYTNGIYADEILSYTSNFSFILNRTWNNWLLSCGANNKNDTGFAMSAEIQLNVTYPPDGPPIIRNLDDGSAVIGKVNVIIGGFVNLECSVSGGNPLPRLEWNISNASPQTVSGTKVITTLSWQANTTNVDTVLACISTHESIKTSNVRVDVLYPPEIPVITVNTTSGWYQVTNTLDVIEGRSFTLNCSARCNPQASLFKWNNDFQGYNSFLNVEKADRFQLKTISCNVSNVMQISDMKPNVTGTNITHLKVNVLYPPKVNILIDATVIEGEELDYSCNFTDGNPSAKNITWSWKSGLWEGQHLRLKNVSRNQAGIYSCTVRNIMAASDGHLELGNNNDTFNLTVQYEAKILKFSVNDVEAEQITIHENTKVNIFCELEGYPLPIGELLLRTAGYIKNQPIRTFSTSQQPSNLRLSSVFQAQCSDTGLQICSGNNTFYNGWHSISNKSLSLLVYCSPRKYPSFGLNQNVTSALNATVTFYFLTMAYPTPNFQWYRLVNGLETSEPLEGVMMITSTNVMQINYTLKYVSDSDYGEYLLNITNQFGTFQQRFYLVAEATETSTYTFTKSSIVGPAVGGAVGGVLVIVVVVVVVIIARKRLFEKQTHAGSAKCDFNDSHTYTNCSKETRQTSLDSPKLPERMPLKLAAAHNLQELDDYDDKADERTYGNTYEMIKRIERICVPELCPYLTNKTTDFFGMEFQNIPKGLTKPYEFSQKPENIALNRYNGIFPYDHSRVKIPDEPTYFINACYINGYKKKKAFIASLGPLARTTYNFVTFWQMVWSENSDVIVMLTKLKEPSGVKCDQYWPETDTTQSYGEVTVRSLGEEEYSDYVLRKFAVSKGNTKRKLIQFHFMAWPDKSVPEDVTCVLEFRKRVYANHSSGPIIVHCSAGIGRTGTLIAIEILIEEGQREGSVNIVECVKTMRDQRTSMVQTVDQYHYVYKALVNALVFDCESIALQKFPKYLDKTNTDQFNKMFQSFNQSVESDSTAESNARTANKMQRDKNRIGSDIPGDSHRVRLFLNRYEDTSTDYTNAVYIDSFTKSEHFVVAQSPMTNGVEDFLCMIYQVECTCVVELGDSRHGKNVGMFIPTDDTQSLAIGCFKVTCKVLDTKDNYIIRKVKIEFKGRYEGGEKDVYHFGYNDWALGQKTPNDPQTFVAFAQEVEEFASQLGTGKSQVLVHCLNAFERSCLFCAVVTLVEKVKYEGEVCVPNVLRHIRARRKLAIPNMDQFQFCFKAVRAYISKDKTEPSDEEKAYINMALV